MADVEAPRPGAGWQLNPHSSDRWEIEQYFSDDGECIAVVDGAIYDDAPSYPHAFDPIDGLWKRGGPRTSTVEAKAWAERVAGIRPLLPGESSGIAHHPLVGRDPSVRLR